MAIPKDFGFGEEETMVRDSVRKLLRERAPIETVRTMVAGDHERAYESEIPPADYDKELWHEMVELGLSALWVPAETGGAGMKAVAAVSVLEELGRAALPSPLGATLSATAVLRACGEPAHPLLGEIAAGRSATLATSDASGGWELERSDAALGHRGTGWTLEGEASFVQDARKAERFIVAAESEEGPALVAVEAGQAGVTIVPDRIVDLTRDQARLRFENVKVADTDLLAAPGSARDVMARAMPAILTFLAADISGAAEWQLQTTTEYAKIRTQFNRPIGFFQAVKHPIVDMMVDIDRARSLVYAAACALDTHPDDAERLARMAKAAASDAAGFCSGRSVQLHGGIGFTWECDLHIYFKRQQHSRAAFGDGAYNRARLAETH